MSTEDTMTDREKVARTICAHSVGGFCLNVGGSLGCRVGRGQAPDYRLCVADRLQLDLSGNSDVADAVLEALSTTTTASPSEHQRR
jgi:hypothetical protein